RPATFVCDVTVEDEVQAMVDGTVAAHGRLDVLVNNAGLGGTAPLVEMTDDEWHRVLDVTLTGTMRVTRAALRHLVAAGRGGAIVNNASVLGWRAQAGQAHYAAAKAGVMALTRCAAVEAAPHGVRVNAVAPSLAMHPFLSKVMDQATLDQLAQQEAFGRAAEPWEVATVIAFLASDLSGYMTGEGVSVSSQHPSAASGAHPLHHLRRAASGHRHPPRLDRLARDHPGPGEPVRGGHRRPPVDPRRRGAGHPGGSLRRPDRPRLPHPGAHQPAPPPADRRARRVERCELRHRAGPL